MLHHYFIITVVIITIIIVYYDYDSVILFNWFRYFNPIAGLKYLEQWVYIFTYWREKGLCGTKKSSLFYMTILNISTVIVAISHDHKSITKLNKKIP